MQLIRFAFQQRRKKLSNSLKNYFSIKNIQISDLPENINAYFNKRPEELSPADFLILYNFLQTQKKS
jgi:16S rRNA A1518/A1519 N6-dimethyltransferase RsmA/KsgA/DIM1 with predicted DNA glycosylase/AP lyase activity